MKKTLTCALLASLFTLTACGGGGGADDPATSPVAVNQPTNGGTTTTPTTNGFVVSGKAIKFENGKQTGTMNSEYEEQYLQIKVEDKQFGLAINHTNYNKVSSAAYNPTTGEPDEYTGQMQYATYGAFGYPNTQTMYVYYIGKHNITKDMPTTGTAKYLGNLIAYRPSDKQVFATYTPVDFNVDFGKKTVNAKIDKLNNITRDVFSLEEIKNIELSATIKGNTFSGTKNGVTTEGVFVGPKAVEMTGLFNDSKNKIQGAFGARQQGK